MAFQMNDLFNNPGFSPDLGLGSLGNFGYTAPSMMPNTAPPLGGGAPAPAPAQGVANLWSALTGGGGGGVSPTSAAGGDGMFSLRGIFGGTNDKGQATMGWGMPVIQGASAVMGGLQGMKQMKMAEDLFKENKRQFDLNYGAQRQTTNTQLEDRQRARVASNPNAYESVGAYMDKNRIR